MKTFVVLACLAVAANGDSESNAYTIGQVAHGYAPGIVTGIDYGYGHVSGYGAVGNRGYLGYAGHIGYGHGYGLAGYGGYGHHFGKRSADSESEAYTIAQVAHGLPVHNAYATGHPHNVGIITGISHGYGHGYGYGGYGYAGHGFGGLGYAGHGYTGLGYGYGK